jgi:hypothetical protein
MSVKAWINRVENKNSYLPIIKEDAKPLTGNSIISEIIYNNIPSKGKLQFKLHGLHKQTSINAIIPALITLEENIKPAANTTSSIQNKKQGQNTNLKILVASMEVIMNGTIVAPLFSLVTIGSLKFNTL